MNRSVSRSSSNQSICDASSISSYICDDTSQDSISGNVLPPLIDAKTVCKLYPIILANLPDNYTLEEVVDLVAESEPMAITTISYTERRNIKFCEIYLRNKNDLTYLKRKLNGFVISGKKLIAVGPGDLFGEIQWDL